MVNILSPANEQFVNNVDTIQQRLNQVTEQLSSGYRIRQASDDPSVLGDLFETRSQLANSNQVTQNLNLVKGEVTTADSSVQSAISLLDNVRTLAEQGANSTTSAQQQTALAGQVQGVLAQLVGLTRTQVNGIYIFSGDQTSSPPYQLDPNSPNGVDRLVTAPATRQIQDSTGLTFAVAQTAQDLFDKRDANDNFAPENVFAAVTNIQVALQNNDQPGLTTAIGQLQTAEDYLNQQSAFYGGVENRIASATDLAQKFQTQLQAQLSSEQDTDVLSAALQLTQDTTDLNAALAAQGKRPTSTLFDFIPVG
jgi:flagellar hook-associated protein 3 FlgL